MPCTVVFKYKTKTDMTAAVPFSSAKRQPLFQRGNKKNVFNVNMLDKNKYIE